jgi:transketolase
VLRLKHSQKTLSSEDLVSFETMWKECTSDILHCTSLSACGHPGGSMSSLHFLLALYALSNITPENLKTKERDRIIVSNGHISPGVYSVLAQYGFFDREEMILNFRKTGSIFSGHVENGVPGVEWNTGNLGQGLSTACGIAWVQKQQKQSNKVIVCMGDGEQQKGQISEARRFATQFRLNNLIALIDLNRYQIGGATQNIMQQDISAEYKASGWNVLEVKGGHNFEDVFQGLRKAWINQVKNPNVPTVILLHTLMGYGVSFMQDICDYHGKACSEEEHAKAMDELNLENRLKEFQDKRKALPYMSSARVVEHQKKPKVNLGIPITYDVKTYIDNRSAYGSALADLGRLNNTDDKYAKIVGISCDLEASVKMSEFRKESPKYFIEGGIQEHNNAVVAGAISKENMQTFFSTFGIFGVDEVYNQQRLNSFNETNVKTVCTHLGLSVGEDGPTHQSIDYVGLLRNIFGYQVLIPADPNQTDHMVRYAAGIYGNVFIGMGRAKTPIISQDGQTPYFGSDYTFELGQANIIREGNDATIMSYGPLLIYAFEAAKKLKEEHDLNVRVINMGSLVPCDEVAIVAASNETKIIVTMEDHHIDTGLGSIVASVLASKQLSPKFKALGVARFSYSGAPSELYREHGLDVENVVKTVTTLSLQ